MRRVGFIVVSLIVGCGVNVIGVSDEPSLATPQQEAGPPSSLPGTADFDGAVQDAPNELESQRPDAGVTFVPSHIAPNVYRLDAPDLTTASAIDTTNLTIDKNTGTFVADPEHFKADGNRAVLSVHHLTVALPLKVSGSRSLVIVASGDVYIGSLIDGSATKNAAGPGGGTSDQGPGAGKAGGAAPKFGGGGGGGYGTAGANGEPLPFTLLGPGSGGSAYNADGALLLGGSGGATAAGAIDPSCASKNRGGAGGGAIQITSLGFITMAAAGRIHVGGGGGLAGCKGSFPPPSDKPRGGGGGGGSGGLVYLESVKGMDVQAGAIISATGGGGGQGGDKGAESDDGDDGPLTGSALGGLTVVSGGGAGGAGGTGTGIITAPANGLGGAEPSGGGGGGALGRLFLRTRSGSFASNMGIINAIVVTETNF